MALETHGSAHWSGSLKDGRGTVSTASRALDSAPYDFGKRFDGELGLNPEELVGAAHAACFSMALSKTLADHGNAPESIDTKATVTLSKDDGGFSITEVHLDVEGDVPGVDEESFLAAAKAAKDGCPLSKLIAGGSAEITMDARLQSRSRS